MASLLDNVEQHTQLAGHNRLELLIFKLGDDQSYGINVFKIQEVMYCPPVTQIPNSNPVVKGVVTVRGKTFPVIDLAKSVGKKGLDKTDGNLVMVAEYNCTVQGFLVSSVDRILNMNWEDIKPPPKGLGASCYLTAVTEVDGHFVEILDVEKVLSEILHYSTQISEESESVSKEHDLSDKFFLVVDDSMVARKQIMRPLDQIGVEYVMAKNGREALDLLKDWAKNEPDTLRKLSMVISDVEMPEMDGYTLTTEIRKDPDLKDLYIMLHTSLSGVFNSAMVEKVGADIFLPKYDAEQLAKAVLERIKMLSGG